MICELKRNSRLCVQLSTGTEPATKGLPAAPAHQPPDGPVNPPSPQSTSVLLFCVEPRAHPQSNAPSMVHHHLNPAAIHSSMTPPFQGNRLKFENKDCRSAAQLPRVLAPNDLPSADLAGQRRLAAWSDLLGGNRKHARKRPV